MDIVYVSCSTINSLYPTNNLDCATFYRISIFRIWIELNQWIKSVHINFEIKESNFIFLFETAVKYHKTWWDVLIALYAKIYHMYLSNIETSKIKSNPVFSKISKFNLVDSWQKYEGTTMILLRTIEYRLMKIWRIRK